MDKQVQPWAWGVTALFVAIAAGVATLGFRGGVTFNPPDGISAFAVFSLVAAGIERTLEPFSGLLVRVRKPASEGGGAQLVAKSDIPAESVGAASDAAQAETNGMLIMWGAATLVGALACWYFGLSLFKAIGVGGDVADSVALFGTALIVGSGTKPLHDAISALQKAKS